MFNVTDAPTRYRQHHSGKKITISSKTSYRGYNVDAAIYRCSPNLDVQHFKQIKSAVFIQRLSRIHDNMHIPKNNLSVFIKWYTSAFQLSMNGFSIYSLARWNWFSDVTGCM